MSDKIYVLAHRCNTRGWFDHALKWKSNGVEIDITKDNGKLYAWHGDIARGSWEVLSDYVVHIRNRLLNDTDGKKVSLLLFDLKYDENDGLTATDIDEIRSLVKREISDHVNNGKSVDQGLFVLYGTYEGKYADKMAKSIEGMPLLSWEGVNYDSNRETSPAIAKE